MNPEPQQEAPRRRERPKVEVPTPAMVRQRAEEEMRSVRELITKSQAEITSSGGTMSPELERQRKKAEAAYTELQEAIQEATTPQEKIEETPFDENEHFGRVMDTFSQAPVSFSDFESLRAEGIGNREKSRVMKEALVNRMGERYAEKMLSPEYTRKLEALQGFLESRIEGMKDVLICDPEQLTIENLIAIHETLGSPEAIRDLIAAYDLRKEAPELEYEKDLTLIQPAKANFDLKSGELDADITVALRYGVEDTYLVHGFLNKPKQQKDGSWKGERSVELDLFRIQEDLENRGMAKEMLKRSLDWYLEQNEQGPENPLANIRLNANINVGGYAWASYGFGWDKDQMVDKYKRKQFSPSAKNTNKSPEEREGIFKAMVKDMAESTKERWKQAADHVRDRGANEEEEAQIKAIEAEFDRAIADSEDDNLRESVTPQRLAVIGKDGPRFMQDEYGDWYTERQFKEARAVSGEGSTGPVHAGKQGLLKENWYGKIELTKTGAQGGKNLALLQKRLA